MTEKVWGIINAMDYQLIQTPEGLEKMAIDWNGLLDQSASHVPFLRFEYQRAWWQTLGGGEWRQAELAVVAAYQDGQLCGVAPLFASRNREDEPALLLMGSVEVSDYLDVIARPADLPVFFEGLLPFLASLEKPLWQVLDWYNLLDNSPTLPALSQAAARMGWSFSQEVLQRSPFIALPGDWETYLAGINKKQRHEIRRKMRRLEESGLPFRWYFVEDEASLDSEMEAFLDLMAQEPDKAAFLTPLMREHMRSVMTCSFDAGCLNLAFLEINGEKAAAYLNFDYLDRIWVYNSGVNRSYLEYSPGWVLLAYLLRWANEQKLKEFDFMRGDEDYKYRFGAVDRYVVRAVIRRQ
jgi:CelD/BcsL family acetyltransferase involved in cellulose biosynthesis